MVSINLREACFQYLQELRAGTSSRLLKVNKVLKGYTLLGLNKNITQYLGSMKRIPYSLYVNKTILIMHRYHLLTNSER